MPKGLVNESSLNSIAEAINVLNGTEGTYAPSEMGAEIIDAIPSVTVSGAVASITNAAKYNAESVEFDIEPVQDLHGYDKPWPAGGGKNLINAPDITLDAAGDVFNGSCSLAAGTYTLSSSNTSVSVSVAGVSGVMPLTFTLADAVTSLQIEASAAGTFNNIQIETGSTATSYAPYSNICPITGWTGVKGEKTGKNLSPTQPIRYSETNFGVDEIPLKSGTYTVSYIGDDSKIYIREAIGSQINSGTVVYSTAGHASHCTFTISKDGLYRVQLYRQTSVGNWDVEGRVLPTQFQLELGSTATTYEPYQGEEINVEFPALGKNLLDISKFKDYTNGNSVTAGSGTNYDLYSGTVGLNTAFPIASIGLLTYLPTGTYTFSCTVSANCTIVICSVNPETGAVAAVANTSYSGASKVSTFAIETAAYITLRIADGSKTITNPQIESGSTATAYEPYTNTVYGGSLNLTSGVLTVDRAYDQMTYEYLSNLASDMIGYSSDIPQVGGNAVWVRNWKYTDYPGYKGGGIKCLCNAFPIDMHDSNIFASQYRTYIGIGTMTSVEEFLAAVQALENAGSGVFIAHELLTPITYQLTPQQLQLFKLNNNIWADTGDTSVTYKVDLATYIQKLIDEASGTV